MIEGAACQLLSASPTTWPGANGAMVGTTVLAKTPATTQDVSPAYHSIVVRDSASFLRPKEKGERGTGAERGS